ncbi:hypothetical protein KQX54_008597 [Cotesia glomerata]|uniref:Uncharacterized protein n=1 Tax=Cotesia glomerata TaxID=32391 RepID=A0AAV7IK91_COTGL|nr:hypothetical protein KQX54_008597 [Cotesia glomerata]
MTNDDSEEDLSNLPATNDFKSSIKNNEDQKKLLNTFHSQKALDPKKLAKVTKSGVNNENNAILSCFFHNLPSKNLEKVEKNLVKTEKNLGKMDKNFDTWPRVTPECINFTEYYLRQMKTLYARQQQDPAKIATSINIVPEVNQRQYKQKLMPESDILVSATFLEYLTSKRMRRNPNEMTRSLFKKILGVEKLMEIAMTKKNERQKIPKNTYDTVKKFVEFHCKKSVRLTDSEFKKVVTKMLGGLREKQIKINKKSEEQAKINIENKEQAKTDKEDEEPTQENE